jgi:hypothetical protein
MVQYTNVREDTETVAQTVRTDILAGALHRKKRRAASQTLPTLSWFKMGNLSIPTHL